MLDFRFNYLCFVLAGQAFIFVLKQKRSKKFKQKISSAFFYVILPCL
jgi:hypothetical protein